MTSRSRGVRTEKGESPPSCTFPTFVSLLLSWRHSVMGTDTRQLSFLTDFQIVDQTGCAQLGGSQHDQGLTHLYFVRLRAQKVALAAQRQVVNLPATSRKMVGSLRFKGLDNLISRHDSCLNLFQRG